MPECVIDFSRLLSLWLYLFHRPVEEFWRGQNLKTFMAIYNALFPPKETETEESQDSKSPSLYEYLMGGGG